MKRSKIIENYLLLLSYDNPDTHQESNIVTNKDYKLFKFN